MGMILNPYSFGVALTYDTLQHVMRGSPTYTGTTFNVASSAWVRAGQAITTGKWYWEIKGNGSDAATISNIIGGVIESTFPDPASETLGESSNLGWAFWTGLGTKLNGNWTGSAYGVTLTAAADILGVAFDATNKKIFFAKNNTWMNSGDPVAGTGFAYDAMPSSTYYVAVASGSSYSGTSQINFGATAFSYTPPTGFGGVGV